MIPELAKQPLDPEVVDELADELAPSRWEELDVRLALIALGQSEKEVTRLKRLVKAVVEPYNERIHELAGRCATLRANVQHYVEQHGKVDFPDVGAAHLRSNARRFKAVDLEALPRTLHVANPDGGDPLEVELVREELEPKLVVDEDVFEQWVGTLEGREVEVDPGDGSTVSKWLVVDPLSGEVVDGLEYVPESKSVVVKGL